MAKQQKKKSKRRRPARPAPGGDGDLRAARAHLEALGTPYAAQLAALLARLGEKGDRVLGEVAREGIALDRSRAARLREQLMAFTDAVDPANEATPQRTLLLARLAERWLADDERLAHYAERLHRLDLAPDAKRGRRFRQGKAPGKVAWHAVVLKIAEAHPTAPFQ